jgi:peptide/nickel transport system ATP-binding protein
MPPRERRALRGARMSMVMQDPKFSLNPVMAVGDQIAEGYRVIRRAGRREVRPAALADGVGCGCELLEGPRRSPFRAPGRPGAG